LGHNERGRGRKSEGERERERRGGREREAGPGSLCPVTLSVQRTVFANTSSN
jgi:hypothetical protein